MTIRFISSLEFGEKKIFFKKDAYSFRLLSRHNVCIYIYIYSGRFAIGVNRRALINDDFSSSVPTAVQYEIPFSYTLHNMIYLTRNTTSICPENIIKKVIAPFSRNFRSADIGFPFSVHVSESGKLSIRTATLRTALVFYFVGASCALLDRVYKEGRCVKIARRKNGDGNKKIDFWRYVKNIRDMIIIYIYSDTLGRNTKTNRL